MRLLDLLIFAVCAFVIYAIAEVATDDDDFIHRMSVILTVLMILYGLYLYL